MTRTAPKPSPDAQREALVDKAAAELMAGALVIMPTETVYGVGANATNQSAIDRLRAARRPEPSSTDPYPANTWHAPTREAVLKAIELSSPVHRRIVARLTPGPVRLLIDVGEARARAIIESLGAIPGVFDGRGIIAVRVPDHAMTASVLSKVGAPVVMDRLSHFNMGDGQDVSKVGQNPAISMVVDDGRTEFGRPSSTILLNAAGGYKVLSEGAIAAKAIHTRIEKLVLFVCTGNTCRSPMAEAIARGTYERREQNAPRVPLRFASAGIATSDGLPISPESRETLEHLGFPPPPPHSQELTPELVDEAETIYGMTAEHVRAIERVVPKARGKVHLLDPKGGEVPDPIGGPLTQYRDTARKMQPMIEKRLVEIEAASMKA